MLAWVACAAPPARVETGNVLTDPLWDDGRAEYSIYRGTTLRYGQLRSTEARLIVVKEDLLRDALVKSERGPLQGRTVEAVKMNFIADFRTGTYDYHQMASVFFERASMEVLKENMSHTEGCGITTVRVGPERGRWMHHAHSYWEGEADRAVPFAWPDTRRPHLFWDALPVSLRRWVADDGPAERMVWLLPSQVSGHAPLAATRPVSAAVRTADGGMLETPGGRFPTRRFDVITPAGTDTLWFDTRFPHVLVRLRTAAGRRLDLAGTRRLDYWNHHMNGDEKQLPLP
jgi:hypothetical protein